MSLHFHSYLEKAESCLRHALIPQWKNLFSLRQGSSRQD
jgi:hypothetical protein